MKPEIVYMNANYDFSYLNVYTVPNKVRIGRPNDGGHVIVDGLGEYDYFISGGVADDVNFECELLDRYPTLEGDAFHRSIDRLTNEHPRLSFKKKLSRFNNMTCKNLQKYFNKFENIL